MAQRHTFFSRYHHRHIPRTNVVVTPRCAPPIEKLVPDCLFHIYQYLDPLDVANASESSAFLSHFAAANVYAKMADLPIFSSGTKMYKWHEFACVVRHFGPHLTRIKLDKNRLVQASAKHVALVLEHCPRLDELHLVNFIFDYTSVRMLRNLRCSPVRHLVVDNVKQLEHWKELARVWWNVTTLSMYRFAETDLEYVLSGVANLQRITLVKGKLQYKGFNCLRVYASSLHSLTLINNELPNMRYHSLGYFSRIETLQISVKSARDLEALNGMNIKYLQLVREKFYDDPPPWLLGGLRWLEELELVQMKCVAIDLVSASIRALSIRDSSDIPKAMGNMPTMERLFVQRNQWLRPEELVLVENYSKPIDLELVGDAYDVPELRKYLKERKHAHHQSSELKCRHRLLRIIGCKHEPSLVEMSRELRCVEFKLSRDYNRPQHFNQWEKVVCSDLHELYPGFCADDFDDNYEFDNDD